MTGQYYDPHALLADDTLVPTTFHYAVSTMAKTLDPGQPGKDLAANATVDLPLWLARPVADRNIGNINMPSCYSERFRRRASAGAECLNLRPTPYFYHVGLETSKLAHEGSLAAFLRQVFTDRYQELIAGSLKAPDGAALQTVLSKLNEEERQLYEAGRVGAAKQEQWWEGGGSSEARLLAPSRGFGSNSGSKRKRFNAEETNKENQRRDGD